MSETVPFDAFISYSSKDKITADACCAVLEGAGVRCWIAPRDVRPGTEYGSAIMDGIEQSRLMVLIFSSNANSSSQIHREIERAVSKGIPIIPVRIEEVAPTKSMEYFLGAIHWLDALTPPFERHLQQLAETVKAILKINVDTQGRIGGEVVSKNSPLTDRTGRQNASAKSSKRATPSWMVSAICGLALGCLLAGGAWLYQTRLTVPVSSQVTQALHGTLRAAAQARGFLVGAAVAAKPLKEEDAYRQIVAREFNVVVPENAMKFRPVHPARTEFDFADADTIVQFAAANGIKLRGQPLVWDGALLPWLTSENLSPSEISSILKEHIQALVGRYRGQVYSWDVVNDAFDGLGRIRKTFWSKALGDEYLRQVFLWARESDPTAKLFLNNADDYDPLESPERIYDSIRELKARGVPIDGVGLHSHWLLTRAPTISQIAANMKRLATLGLEIHVTELDLRLPMPTTDQDLQRQADFYHDYLSTCLSIANCKAFLTWGFTDKYSWIPRFFPGTGAALPFDPEYKPKPAYKAMLDVLNHP